MILLSSLLLLFIYNSLSQLSLNLLNSKNSSYYGNNQNNSKHVDDNKIVTIFHGKLLNDIHNYLHPLRPIRDDFNWTWKDNMNAIKEGNNRIKWCSLSRDSWSCTGKEYIKTLNTTKPYNIKKFNLFSLPNNTKIFAEANSYVAEIILPIFCESNNKHIKLWKIGQPNSNSFLYDDTKSNIQFMLVDNDYGWNFHPNKTIAMLKSLEYYPTLLLLGNINYYFADEKQQKELTLDARVDLYHNAFNTPILHFTQKNPLPSGCMANDCKNTTQDQNQFHQCYPGPLYRYSEELVATINKVLLN